MVNWVYVYWIKKMWIFSFSNFEAWICWNETAWRHQSALAHLFYGFSDFSLGLLNLKFQNSILWICIFSFLDLKIRFFFSKTFFFQNYIPPIFTTLFSCKLNGRENLIFFLYQLNKFFPVRPPTQSVGWSATRTICSFSFICTIFVLLLYYYIFVLLYYIILYY